MELEDVGLTSLPEEVGLGGDDLLKVGLVGDDLLEVHDGRGRPGERSRKVTMLDRAGPRFLESSRSPFRHSFVDVRVFFLSFLFSCE